MNELKEDLLHLQIQKKRTNPDNLIYQYKNEVQRPKDFRNYQNTIELEKYVRDGNINPNEVLKDQINFKSDVGVIKKGRKIKIKRSNKCNLKCSKIF